MEPHNPYAAQQGQQVQVARQGNGLAVAGMVLGIIALVLFWIWILAGVLGILAIIFGAIGVSRAKRVGTGKGMAIAGIVCGVVGMVLAAVFVIVVVKMVNRELGSSKVDLMKVQVDKIANEWHPRWALKTNEMCPKDLREVARAVNATEEDTKDAWDHDLKFVCDSEGVMFGVFSVGEDGREGTSDDIKSWERRQRR